MIKVSFESRFDNGFGLGKITDKSHVVQGAGELHFHCKGRSEGALISPYPHVEQIDLVYKQSTIMLLMRQLRHGVIAKE